MRLRKSSLTTLFSAKTQPSKWCNDFIYTQQNMICKMFESGGYVETRITSDDIARLFVIILNGHL